MMKTTTSYWGCILLVATALLVPGAGVKWVAADEREDLFAKQTFGDSTGTAISYRLLSPAKIEPGVKYPVVLFLHGAGERGSDNAVQLIHVVKELASDEMRERYPAFVVVPQCPKDSRWVEVPWDADRHDMPERPSGPLGSVIDLMEDLTTSLPIDPNRVYYSGLSMGGYGTWDLLHRQPEKCAGALVICGGGDVAGAERMKEVPVWVFHGAADTVVKPERSRDMVQAIQAAGGHPIYTEFPGVGHDSWNPAAKNRFVWDWLFAQANSN